MQCEVPGCAEDARLIHRSNGIDAQWSRCAAHHRQHVGEVRARARGVAWNPDRKIDSDGYVWVWDEDEARWVSEHRKLMEEMLQRPLRFGESVHHKNSVRDDNRRENLELWLVRVRQGQRGESLLCPHCGKAYA